MSDPQPDKEPLYLIQDSDTPLPGESGAIMFDGIPTENPRHVGTGDKDPRFVNYLFEKIIADMQNEGEK